MTTKSTSEVESGETPVLELPMVNGKNEPIDKFATVLRFYAAEFMIPVMTGNLDSVDVEALTKLRDSVKRICTEFDKALLSLPESERGDLKPFRQPRSDKATKSVDADIFG